MKESQTARILRLLKQDRYVTNTALNKIAFRYSARIADLRAEGYDIRTHRIKDGLFEFSFHGHIEDKVTEMAD